MLKKKCSEAKTHIHQTPWHLSVEFHLSESATKGRLVFLYAACLQMALELKYSLSSL